MENKKTCADCINLGREVYCMKCKPKNATKQESVPLDGIEYNSILEIYSHSLKATSKNPVSFS